MSLKNICVLIGIYNAFCFTGNPIVSTLLKAANNRVHSAMRPSTQMAYQRYFNIFLMFIVFVQVEVQDVDTNVILAFLEFLHFNKFSPHVILNTVSAVKSRLQAYGVCVRHWSDPRVTYFTKSLQHTKQFKAYLPQIIDVNLLKQIITLCDSTLNAVTFKALYLVAFYSFLRISNLVPHCTKSYSPLHQIARGDIFFAPPGIHILVKWTKTLQKKNKAVIVKIPAIQGSILCPVSAVSGLLRLTPGNNDSPLFQVQLFQKWVPLTDTRVRKHFKSILCRLNLANSGITFHHFRKSGATLAFNANASLQSIKAHGTWSSDTVWQYIAQNQDASAEVASTLASIVSS